MNETNKDIVVQGGGELKIGEEYEVHHSRKGTFCMKVMEVSGEWIKGEITSGVAKADMSYNVAYEGESITIRDVHSYFVPLRSTTAGDREGGRE